MLKCDNNNDILTAQHTPKLNILHVLMQPKTKYIACPHATERLCVNQAMNSSSNNEF